MRVDAHHHVWRLARGDYGWLRPTLPIHRDYDLHDLRPLLGDVEATVLVQAAATEAETSFMLETAHASGGLVRAVVGWTDFAAANAPERIAALAGETLLRGLRPMLQDITETAWILRPAVARGLAAMAEAGLRLDLLIRPRHLRLLPDLAQRHPQLAMVIDHGAKPAIAEGRWEPWAADMARAARETGAFCKLSGLATEASPGWRPERLRRYTDHLLACFGPERLMWGSDWPVVEMGGGYKRWRDAAHALVPAAAQQAVFGDTAARFYGFG
ncbi:MAG: amidohydrolase family protein [Acetobacteraceae bacterium]|nr:amidohydrolase family protein [Acetobacteraceae bacterium]